MESTISIKHNETHQKMNEMNQQIIHCDQNIKSLYETSAGQDKAIKKLEGDNVQVNTSILNTKTELLQAINEQWKKTLNLNEKVEQKLHEIKEVTDESMQQSQSNTNRINVIENLQDTISRLSTNNDIEIKNIWKQKVDLDAYQKEISRINNQFRSAAFSIETVENMLKNTDR
jgi:DNA repair ATPase RecN